MLQVRARNYLCMCLCAPSRYPCMHAPVCVPVLEVIKTYSNEMNKTVYRYKYGRIDTAADRFYCKYRYNYNCDSICKKPQTNIFSIKHYKTWYKKAFYKKTYRV